MHPIKIIIEIRGGNLTALLSNVDLRYVVIDYDNIDSGDDPVCEPSKPDAIGANDAEKKIILSSMILLLFVLSVVFINERNAVNRIKRKGIGKRIEFTVNSSILQSPTDSCIYIGRTSNYVFLWNKLREETEIYPASEIKKIVIGE